MCMLHAYCDHSTLHSIPHLFEYSNSKKKKYNNYVLIIFEPSKLYNTSVECMHKYPLFFDNCRVRNAKVAHSQQLKSVETKENKIK